MERVKRSIAGLISFAPIVLFIAFMFTRPFIQNDSPAEWSDAPGVGLYTIWDMYPGILGKATLTAAALGLLFSWVLAFLVYRGHITSESRRRLWVFVLIFGNVYVLPVFWMVYFRRRKARVKL